MRRRVEATAREVHVEVYGGVKADNMGAVAEEGAETMVLVPSSPTEDTTNDRKIGLGARYTMINSRIGGARKVYLL